MNIKKVGVIGAGTMGSGIATVALEAGFTVILHDTTDELAKRGIANVAANFGRAVKKGKIGRAHV